MPRHQERELEGYCEHCGSVIERVISGSVSIHVGNATLCAKLQELTRRVERLEAQVEK